MSSFMVESTTKMLNRWAELINSGEPEIDVEREIIATAGEIIAKSSFGISHEDGKKVLDKLRAMQITLFKSNRFVGVPFNQFITPKHTVEARRLGKEIDTLLKSIISARRKDIGGMRVTGQRDLLGLLLEENRDDGRPAKTLSTRELVDECKTFFFGGHETTALALSWTLLNLAQHPEWQEQLRDEIRQVIGDKEVDATMLPGLKKVTPYVYYCFCKHMQFSLELITPFARTEFSVDNLARTLVSTRCFVILAWRDTRDEF